MVLLPAAAEEIPHRALHRGRGLAVPVHAQDSVAPLPRGGHPDVLNGAGPLDVGNFKGLPRRHTDVGVYLPALAQVPGRPLGRAVLQLALGPGALGPRKVLRADGTGNAPRKQGEVDVYKRQPPTHSTQPRNRAPNSPATPVNTHRFFMFLSPFPGLSSFPIYSILQYRGAAVNGFYPL